MRRTFQQRLLAIPGSLILLFFFASTTPTQTGAAQRGTAEQRTARYFESIRKSPPQQWAFLLKMPKGGDLHNHLGGAAYAENMLESAARNSLCIDESSMSITRPEAGGQCAAGQVEAARAEVDNRLSNSLVEAFSMRDFVPGKESNHDHFFATFDKFGAVVVQDAGTLVAEVVRRAEMGIDQGKAVRSGGHYGLLLPV